MHGDNARANAGEGCRYRFQLNVHAVDNHGEFDRNEKSGLSTVPLKSAGAHVVQPSSKSGILLQARIRNTSRNVVYYDVTLWNGFSEEENQGHELTNRVIEVFSRDHRAIRDLPA
jgi:hypothetical protein